MPHHSCLFTALSRTQCMPVLKRLGAKTHPCRTPDEIGKEGLSCPSTLTELDVSEYSAEISPMNFCGTPRDASSCQRAGLNTKSKAALRSTYAAYRGWRNFFLVCATRFRDRIRSTVERPGVNPLCCGRRFSRSSGFIRSSRICANAFPGTERSVMPL